MIPAVGLILALCGFAVSVAVSVLIVWRYTDRRDKDLIPIVITTVSLSLVFFCVVLIPIDVYSLGSSQSSQSASLTYSFSSISSSSEAGEVLSTSFMPGVIKCLYYVFFGLLSLCVFVAIPFGYFYFEESEDDDITPKERVVTACKYTVFTVLTVVILLVIGAFVHTGSSGSDKQSATSAWYTYVRESSGVFARGVGFVASIIGLLGLAVWLVYTAYGLSGLPVGLMRGKKHVADELNETQRDLEKTRQRLRDLRDKHAGGAKMSLKDTQEFNILKQQEKIYARHADLLMGEKESRLTRCLAYLKPFSIVLGAVLVIVSVFLLISIAISLIGKALNSTCGHSCGFMFSIPKVSNPLDIMLVLFADVTQKKKKSSQTQHNSFMLQHLYIFSLSLFFISFISSFLSL